MYLKSIPVQVSVSRYKIQQCLDTDTLSRYRYKIHHLNTDTLSRYRYKIHHLDTVQDTVSYI